MKSWRAAYVIAANTALLIMVVQLAAHGAIKAYQMSARQRLEPPNHWVLAQLSDLTRAEIEELWRLTGWVPFRYAGAAGFLQQTTSSRHVNINQYGIRSNGDPHRGINALHGATWFFGGSTTFGFAVRDRDTIPAQLETLIGTPVINLGVRGHGSTMENRLFNYYLRAGYRPARAVFLDGINEVCAPDLFSAEMTRLVARMQDGYAWEFGKPVVFAARGLATLLRRISGPQGARRPELALACDDHGRSNPLSAIVTRTLAERDAWCRLYGVPCRTFVQPFAAVHGRHDDHAFVNSLEAVELRELFAHLEPVWRAAGAVFVTHALDGVDRHVWTDEIHYNAEGTRLIADAIKGHLP